MEIRNLTISSTNPCLLVYLIDQSGSMDGRFGNSRNLKAIEVANAINETIYEVGLRCIEGSEIKNRFEIAVIGYGKEDDGVQSAWEGPLKNKWVVSIKNIFDYPLGQDNGKPIWVRPYHVSNTPMTKAFLNARRLCDDWIKWGNHAECHPPIVINITDGEATDGGRNFVDLINEVNRLKSLRTNYGQVNVFNIHISDKGGDRILYPNNILSNDSYQNLLFNLSSNLDENMIRIANQKNYNIGLGSKGYVFNGNASDLINFLNIGTPH